MWPPRYCKAVAENEWFRVADIIQKERPGTLAERHYSSLENNSKSEESSPRDEFSRIKEEEENISIFYATLQCCEHWGCL